MASLKKRGKTYYAQNTLAGQQKRVSLHTRSLQIAKDSLRTIKKIESLNLAIKERDQIKAARKLQARDKEIRTEWYITDESPKT
jgi:hypothetical protein